MIQRYEVLMLAVPEITQDEIKSIEGSVEKLIAQAKGTVLSFEKWGKFKLSYPIKKNEYGVYLLARYETPYGSKINEELRELYKVKLDSEIMRHVITSLDLESPLEYQRPKSVEEAPASRDMNTFLKENKMEGVLSSAGSRVEKAESVESEKDVTSQDEA